MADGQWGGYRKPGNPAPVSGPGALSKRTDGGVPRLDVTGMSYGENGALNAAQSAAPLSAPGGGGAPAPQVSAPTPLGAPSAFANEPVTAGADHGAGPSSADIGLAQGSNEEIRKTLGPYLPVLMRLADSATATASYKRQVRQLIARITQ